MHRNRRAPVVGAICLGLFLLGVFVSAEPVGAATTGTGTYSCSPSETPALGKVTFKPAWRNTGSGTVRATLSLTADNCTGGSPTPSKVTITGKFKFKDGGGGCSSGAYTIGNLKFTYSPKVKPSYLVAVELVISGGAALESIPQSSGITGSYPAGNNSPRVWANFVGANSGNCTTGITADYLSAANTPEFSNF